MGFALTGLEKAAKSIRWKLVCFEANTCVSGEQLYDELMVYGNFYANSSHLTFFLLWGGEKHEDREFNGTTFIWIHTKREFIMTFCHPRRCCLLFSLKKIQIISRRARGEEGEGERATVNVSCLFQMRKYISPFLQVIRRHLLMEQPWKWKISIVAVAWGSEKNSARCFLTTAKIFTDIFIHATSTFLCYDRLQQYFHSFYSRDFVQWWWKTWAKKD